MMDTAGMSGLRVGTVTGIMIAAWESVITDY
jgi:hypothetical protein